MRYRSVRVQAEPEYALQQTEPGTERPTQQDEVRQPPLPAYLEAQPGEQKRETLTSSSSHGATV